MKLPVMSVILSSLLMATAAHADMRHAKYSGEVELATAVAQPSDTTIKGIAWHCEAKRCTATANEWPGLDSFAKQCRIVATELGQLTKFRSSGRIASDGEVSNCNAAARLAKKDLKLDQEVAKK